MAAASSARPSRAAPAPASCTNGVKDATETDVDCGGACAKCVDGKSCAVGTDCTDGVCKDTGAGLKCQLPSNSDGVKNGTETGIDCGGMGNPKCANGQDCTTRADCTSDYCKTGKCAATGPMDGAQNGTETDVDCGGPGAAPRCADALKCLVDTDCKNDVCKDLKDGKGLRCQAPSYTDGKLNGLETDVDCGGDTAHPCATGKICKVSGDCTTLGCNYKFKCAAGRSCTNPGGWGADTCGYGGEGPPAMVAAKDWHDCCEKAPVTATTGPTAGVTVQLDKYEVTAGRMRVFLESVGYNVRGFVKTARAAGKIPLIPGNATATVLEADWDPYLPTSFAGNSNADELVDCDQGGATTATSTVCKPGFEVAGLYTSVRRHLGGTIFKGNNQTSTGCHIGTDAIGGGTHAFRFPNGHGGIRRAARRASIRTRTDEKGMNCVDYLMGQAFCVWDGGRLEARAGADRSVGPRTRSVGRGHSQRAPCLGLLIRRSCPSSPISGRLCSRTARRRRGTAADNTPDQGRPRVRPEGRLLRAHTTCNSHDRHSKCVLKGGDKTYWACRFPWASDAAHHGLCRLTLAERRRRSSTPRTSTATSTRRRKRRSTATTTSSSSRRRAARRGVVQPDTPTSSATRSRSPAMSPA